jgi:2-methylisocitrate lyase-like PEP mutase family enzyme
MSRDEKLATFRALHAGGCFIIPNPRDAGSARVLAALGFAALATTSAGAAWAIGRRDGEGALARSDILANARSIVRAVDIPVPADLEDASA